MLRLKEKGAGVGFDGCVHYGCRSSRVDGPIERTTKYRLRDDAIKLARTARWTKRFALIGEKSELRKKRWDA